MLIENNCIVLLFILNIFIDFSNCNNINNFRFLNESNEIKEIELKNISNCSTISDCFNCSLNPFCRWIWNNETCIEQQEQYIIPKLNITHTEDDIKYINSYINFIRKICFLPFTPFIKNNNSQIYNNISIKYCGPHYITYQLNNYINGFKIELNSISGIYGAKNILCEYVFLSGPSRFEANIEINENETENFLLLFGENGLLLSHNINKSGILEVRNTAQRANTFIYYGLKSFNSSPFKITFKFTPNQESSSQTWGYILIALIIVSFIFILICIIYIRYNSQLFEKKIKISDESQKMKEKNDFNEKSLNSDKEKKQIFENESFNNTKGEEITPDNLLNKKNENKFIFENSKNNELNQLVNICCFDNQLISNVKDIFKAKCGHVYHLQCYKRLLQNSQNINGKLDIMCISCKKIIYP